MVPLGNHPVINGVYAEQEFRVITERDGEAATSPPYDQRDEAVC